MKEYTLFNFNYLFSDHFAQVSDQAKLLYIEMNFFAENGFVANARGILDSRNYDISVLKELINNGDILVLPNRSEMFITSYFVHNKGMDRFSWKKTPYSMYWRGKLWIKENGIATFKPQKQNDYEFSEQIEVPELNNKNEAENKEEKITDEELEEILKEFDEPIK